MSEIQAIRWSDDGLQLLDQRRLPQVEDWLPIDSAAAAAQAIRDLVVRGAPAIGITAAYAVVLAARHWRHAEPAAWARGMAADLAALVASRPTAVNLGWAVERMRRLLPAAPDAATVARLLREAQAIHAEDVAANQAMGELGAALIEPGSCVLTHCNTGALATGGYGTALGVIRSAHRQQRLRRVYASETRPWWQGTRLTAWELAQERIDYELVTEAAVAHLLKLGEIRWVIVGSDRIAANGDVANKIGTYSAAVAARHHGVKFMVVAPTSTIDPDLATGAQIPLEERAASEVTAPTGEPLAPAGADAFNPVFDVTPAELIDAIVTETGVVHAPAGKGVLSLLSQR